MKYFLLLVLARCDGRWSPHIGMYFTASGLMGTLRVGWRWPGTIVLWRVTLLAAFFVSSSCWPYRLSSIRKKTHFPPMVALRLASVGSSPGGPPLKLPGAGFSSRRSFPLQTRKCPGWSGLPHVVSRLVAARQAHAPPRPASWAPALRPLWSRLHFLSRARKLEAGGALDRGRGAAFMANRALGSSRSPEKWVGRLQT